MLGRITLDLLPPQLLSPGSVGSIELDRIARNSDFFQVDSGVMHAVLGRRQGRAAFLRSVVQETLTIVDLELVDYERMAELVEGYAVFPLGTTGSASPRSQRLTGAISPHLHRLLGSGEAVYSGGVTGQVISVAPLMCETLERDAGRGWPERSCWTAIDNATQTLRPCRTWNVAPDRHHSTGVAPGPAPARRRASTPCIDAVHGRRSSARPHLRSAKTPSPAPASRALPGRVSVIARAVLVLHHADGWPNSVIKYAATATDKGSMNA
jgi:hypothetical protein